MDHYVCLHQQITSVFVTVLGVTQSTFARIRCVLSLPLCSCSLFFSSFFIQKRGYRCTDITTQGMFTGSTWEWASLQVSPINVFSGLCTFCIQLPDGLTNDFQAVNL